MGFRARFTEHPASVGETYAEHFRVASHFAAELAKASFACAVHAIYPRAHTRTASARVARLHAEMTSGARGEVAEVAEMRPATAVYAVGSATRRM